LRAAIRLLEPDGIVECPGGHYAPTELDLFGMYVRGVTLHTGTANAREHIQPAFHLLADGRIHPQRVMGTAQPIEHAADALIEPSLKPVFVRPQSNE
jgi:alcohol dehydrogenase